MAYAWRWLRSLIFVGQMYLMMLVIGLLYLPGAILSPEGVVLAKGLVRYTSDEARLIAGHRSGEIEAILGYQGRAALVHRDDLVM